MEIRAKDKLFLAVVLPIAAVAAYCHFWRADASRRLESLTRESDSLVAVDDFQFERQRAERKLKSAQAALETERGVPMPATKVKADSGDAVAARELEVIGVFRRDGLAVTAAIPAGGEGARRDDDAVTTVGRDVLRETGSRPNPVCRTYEIVGEFPDVLRALRTFSLREMAVVPDRMEMVSPGHWRMSLWL